MTDSKKILGLIPARAGSKGIPNKNLALLRGRPLIDYTIKAGLAAPGLSRLVVSTDDQETASIARNLGAETPFLRPAEFAGDSSPAIEVIIHALNWLYRNEKWQSEAVVYLQPTSPLRRSKHITEALNIFWGEKADSVVSVMEVPHNMNPISVMKLEQGQLVPFLTCADPLRRQDKPKLYARNGPAVLIIKTEIILKQGLLYGPKTLPYMMNSIDSLDIDTPFDLKIAEWILKDKVY